MPSRDDRLWSLVLAGGEGERVRPLVERWLGRHVPKQYCTFVGTRSMFQHTLDRAGELSVPEHTVTVIARAHQELAVAQLGGRRRLGVVAQPLNRDTATGILLALAYVRRHDPGAAVVILPSDHFVWPEDRFLRAVRSAAKAAVHLEDRLVLLGVVPDRCELDYGWITQGPDLGWLGGQRLRSVRAFLEKPGLEDAKAAYASGALWNTMVVAGRAATFWALGWKHLAELMPHFEHLVEAIGTPEEDLLLQAIYDVLPRKNFSSDLLEKAWSNAAVLELEGVLWSDWGRPERIVQTLGRLGKPSPFRPQQRAEQHR